MCRLNIQKQLILLYAFTVIFIFHNSNGYLLKRSTDVDKVQNFDETRSKIISEEDPTKDPGAGRGKPDTLPHALSRRQSVGSFSRLYLCKWLNPREEILSLPMCTRTGDFPYLNECRVFRHCINVGSTTVKACCPVGLHFDHILRECVPAKDARCLTRDLQDQFMDSAFYEESAVDLPHTDVVHVDDYVQNVHGDVAVDDVVDDDDDDSEPLDDSFEVINPSVLANNDKTWKYYPAPPHLYPGAFWKHNPYTGRMEPGKYGYAMPIWMSYSIEPVQKIRPPTFKKPKPSPMPSSSEKPESGSDSGKDGSEKRRSTEEGVGIPGIHAEWVAEVDDDDDDEGGNSEDSEENKSTDGNGQTTDENDKSSQSSSQAPVTPSTTPPSITTTSSENSLVTPVISQAPPAPPPPPIVTTVKPTTTPLPPVEVITFTTKPSERPLQSSSQYYGSDEDNGFEVDTISKTTTPKSSPAPSPNPNNGQRAPVGKLSNEPPPALVRFLGKFDFEDSSEEDNGKGKKNKRDSGDHDDDDHQTTITPSEETTPKQVENNERNTPSEKQLSVLPDFENSNEEEGEISNGGIQTTSNHIASSSSITKGNNRNVEQIASQSSPKRKRQVPLNMMRRIIPRPRPDYFYYNY